MKLLHKKINTLCVKIDGYILSFDSIYNFLLYNENDYFSFYYYEKDLKEFLLKENIIELDDVEDNIEWYGFSNYKKLKKIKDKIENEIKVKDTELKRDFMIDKLNLDEA